MAVLSISEVLPDLLSPIKELNKLETSVEEQKDLSKSTVMGVHSICRNNTVSGEVLKEIQKNTLKDIAEDLAKTYGPMGSYTEIILGSNQDNTYAKYSKDGLTVLKHKYYDSPIEMTIQSEIEEVCRYVEKVVGDGTTSASILSYHIFLAILEVEKKYKILPRTIVKYLGEIIEKIKEFIEAKATPLTLEDVYKICMISTNGNKDISDNIHQIYQEHGLNVDIDVDISTDKNSWVKEYDGITFDEGYSDEAYVNNPGKNTVDIHDASIYCFADPADDARMISLFEKIIHDNVFIPISNGKKPVPTVIMCPKLSRDSSSLLNQLVSMLYEYNRNGMVNQKPMILVLTNYLGVSEGIAYDISRICGCKEIHKYINPEHEKHDIETGMGATLENIHEFAGHAELVSADAERTKFINPKNPEIAESLISFLEKELERCEKDGEDPTTKSRVKNRLRRLKTNNVTYYIGGITISDRDSLRDLVIDAVKNCASASKYGVGRAANYEGLLASYIVARDMEDNNIKKDIAKGVFQAYYKASEILYRTVVTTDEIAHNLVKSSLMRSAPFNIVDFVDEKVEDQHDVDIRNIDVLCSIRTDIEILDAIYKIVSLMATSNQCLLQSTSLNHY